MSKEEKDEIQKLKNNNKTEKGSEGNETLQFFLGIIMLGLGLFMLSKRVMVHSSWYIWRIGSFDLTSGLVTVPLIIGIIWKFYNPNATC